MGTVVSFHAHPDDESIPSGGTLAAAHAEGHRTVLVVATRGELGEVAPDVLVPGETLAERRTVELMEAARVLGIDRVEFLGYLDSGMAGSESNDAPGSFWSADPDEAADRLAVILDEERPDVLTVYDEHGGYGHPDHIQAHRVTHYAVALAQAASHRPDLGPAWQVSKVYWSALPRSIIEQGMRALVEAGDTRLFGGEEVGEMTFIVEDALVTTVIDAGAQAPRKIAALRAHRTQVTDDGPFFAMADLLGPHVLGVEYYRLAGGAAHGDPTHPQGWETDLFAGVD